MLQQTQVVTVIPYFERFITRFPDVATLASADSQDVLRLWEGLGYYSRARNLHQAARQIVTQRGGQFPTTCEDWRSLPGIGPYTAAAIASIAFGEPVPSVDGNVLRVCARLWGIRDPIRDPRVATRVRARLTPLILSVNPSFFNQALMETGALVCRPRHPDCEACALAADCVAFRRGLTGILPIVYRAAPVPHHRVAVGVIWKQDRVLIARRHEHQMLGGLWEFPGGKPRPRESLQQAVRREVREETGLEVRVGEPLLTVRHAYSHFRITLTAFRCEWLSGRARPLASAAVEWIRPAELPDYPFPRANRRISDRVLRDATPPGTGEEGLPPPRPRVQPPRRCGVPVRSTRATNGRDVLAAKR